MPESAIYVLERKSSEIVGDAYGRLSAPLDTGVLPRYLARGSVIVVRPNAGSTLADVRAVVEQLARYVVNAPVALWLDCVSREAGTRLASATRPIGVRTVIWASEPTTAMLRPQLTDPLDWGNTVVLWLRRRGVDITPETAAALECFARRAAKYRTLAGLADAEGVSCVRWRRVNFKAGLGSLRAWYSALRAVGIGVEIQRHPDSPLAELAFTRGFSGLPSMSDRLNDIIGARPSYIRSRLGGQWMLADALRRAGVL